MFLNFQEGINDGNIMSIMEGGVIRTFEKTEVGCIHARDLNTGRSEIAACVRVAEVSSLTYSFVQFHVLFLLAY